MLCNVGQTLAGFHLGGRGGPFAFLAPHLETGDEAAEIAVASPVAHEQRPASGSFHRDLGPDVGPDPQLLGGLVKAGRPVDAVPVEKRQRGHAALGADLRHLFGQGSTLEKAEGGAGVQLDVHGMGAGVLFRLFFAIPS